jgi:hypothetical protein
MGVIRSSRFAEMLRRVWSFKDGPQSILDQWLAEAEATDLDVSDLKAKIMLYEYGGERAIAYASEDIGDKLYVLRFGSKSTQPFTPIFHLGPFSDLELTFLAGGTWKDGVLRPYSAKGQALDNLEKLGEDPNRRTRWTS